MSFAEDRKFKPYIYNGQRAMDLASSPPPDAVVAGLLHRGHITVLSAPPYSGKSWFSLNIASAVASIDEARTPAPWPGAVLECPGTKVVYLSPDFPASELARRLRKLDQMRSDLVRKDSYWDNIYLVGDAPGVLLPRGLYNMSEEGVSRFIDEVIPEECSLVIIDTLSASLPDTVTENDNAGMARTMGSIQKIASRCNVAVLLIHHTAKPTQGKSETEVWSSVRGAGAISGSASTNALIEQLEDPDHANIRRLRVVSNVSSGMPTTFFEVRPPHYGSDEILYFRPVIDPDKSDIEAVYGKKPWDYLQPDHEYAKDDIAALLVPDPIPNLDRARVVAAYLMTEWYQARLVTKLSRSKNSKIIFTQDQIS
jgi:hypothetical protein